MAKIGKWLTMVLWGIIIISVILMISLMANSSSNEADPSMNSWLSTNIYWIYVLFIFVCVLAVSFAIYQTITDKRAAKRGLFTLLIFFAIGLISYLMGSNEIPQFLGSDKFVEQGILTPNVSRWIDTGLNASYILFIIAILSLVLSPLVKLFDK